MPYATATYHPKSHGVYRKRYDYERQLRRQKRAVVAGATASPGGGGGGGGMCVPCCMCICQPVVDTVARKLTGEPIK